MESIGNIDRQIECRRCGGRFTVRQLILAVEKCYKNLQVSVSPLPCCGDNEELWLRDGLASRGYIYAAGQAHFADMEQYDAPNLKVAYTSGDVTVRLGEFKKRLNRQ